MNSPGSRGRSLGPRVCNQPIEGRSVLGPERQRAAQGDTAAFWGRAGMPAQGLVWRR
jgi:hypothetical protein